MGARQEREHRAVVVTVFNKYLFMLIIKVKPIFITHPKKCEREDTKHSVSSQRIACKISLAIPSNLLRAEHVHLF